ncbi:MAG: hypothetical protein CME65_12805 [Halobacteriovoraceae bacterium]|nr:hypothetical protein [Halobacteriovoraceae bacterium]|tara:strand:- start:8232 stop:9023 length:792 start_codon:yes stop_codon:yes gene_type:complete
MNFLSLVSFAIAFAVLGLGLLSSADDPTIFLDEISAVIVLGGTFAATAIAFRMEKIIMLIKIFLVRVIKGNDVEYKEIIVSLIKISESFSNNPEQAKKIAQDSKNPFLLEAIELATEGILSPGDIYRILRARVESMHQHHLIDASKFKTIGKFPPAFGMMGTTIGMIVLLSNLGGADAAKSIGPAMAICLITTLYGVALANLVIIPIAENLSATSKEIRIKNSIIVEGIKLIMNGKNSILIAEELNSFLLPKERVDWKSVLNT